MTVVADIVFREPVAVVEAYSTVADTVAVVVGRVGIVNLEKTLKTVTLVCGHIVVIAVEVTQKTCREISIERITLNLFLCHLGRHAGSVRIVGIHEQFGNTRIHSGIDLRAVLQLVKFGQFGFEDDVGIGVDLVILTTPEAEVAKQGIDAILRHAVGVVRFGGRRLESGQSLVGIAHLALQVCNQRVKNLVTRRNRQILHFVLRLNGIEVEGHVVERTHQIEVAQGTQAGHFCHKGLSLRAGEVRIDVCHFRSLHGEDVTTVDDVVEALPYGVGVIGADAVAHDVVQTLVHLTAGVVGTVGRTVDHVLGTGLTPHDTTAHHVVRHHSDVAAVNHLLHVGFLIPEVVLRDDVSGFYLQVVATT